jgi:hypothetical protein
VLFFNQSYQIMSLSADLETEVGEGLTIVERIHKCRFLAKSRMMAMGHLNSHSAEQIGLHPGFVAAHDARLQQLFAELRSLNSEAHRLDRVS